MGNFSIKNSTLNSQYEYKDTNIIVVGNFVKDAVSGNLQSINGTCYRNNDGNMGANFGFFNGNPQASGEIDYDLSSMSRADSNIVWDAIDEIQANIVPVDE